MAADVAYLKEPVQQGNDITYKDMVDEREALGESEIQKFFAGSTVLLTGGTGFLGKLFVDKLIRSCPGIKRIYLLARPKKDKEISKRLQEQFDDVLYEKMKKECPNFMEKIGIIEGDVAQIGLGLKDEDREKIINEVEVIIHGAATVRFDEALKLAVQTNLRGTREMILLAKSCTKLKSMVHVSTAYGNCIRDKIEEQYYDSTMAPSKLIDLVENLDENIINNITPGLLGDHPNTYAYTKLAAENLIKEYATGLPVAVLRPSIIISTAKEPVAGWIDNIYGPTGVVVGAAMGLLRALNARPEAVADLVPGDMVVNACIATAWKAARDYKENEATPPPDQPPAIYQFVSGKQKPLTWEKFMYYNEKYGLDTPPLPAFYIYMLYLIRSRWMYQVVIFFLHWVPAYIIDTLCILIGKKPMLKKAYTKIAKFSDVIGYFSVRQWDFHDDNTKRLFSELCDADKEIFDFDISNLDWSDYFINYIRGVRVYILKDPMHTLPDSKRKYKKMLVAHYAIVSILTFLLLRTLWSILCFAFRLF